MNAYERIVKTMREEGARNGGAQCSLGRMVGKRKCRINGNDYSGDDLMVSSECKGKLSEGDTVLCVRARGDLYVIAAKVEEI